MEATESAYLARSASRRPLHEDGDSMSHLGFRVAVVGDLKPKPAPEVTPQQPKP